MLSSRGATGRTIAGVGCDPEAAPIPWHDEALQRRLPWRPVVIDGIATPCNMMNPYTYGNVFEQPLEDVWNGLAARLSRRCVNTPTRHPYCRGCYFLGDTSRRRVWTRGR